MPFSYFLLFLLPLPLLLVLLVLLVLAFLLLYCSFEPGQKHTMLLPRH